jgi:pyrroloquinoline quinone biosynthesis protein B
MRAHVLGSAAGGGFPQWNCGCVNCHGVRMGLVAAQPRLQTSVAIEASDASWFLIHASPDIARQITAFAPLHPQVLRGTPISGIFLTNGDVDQCLGLLSLRESQPLQVYATEVVRRGFVEANRLYRVLDRFPGQVTWHELKLEVAQELHTPHNTTAALSVTAIAVPGKVPLYLEGMAGMEPSHNVALLFTDLKTGRRLGYAPSVGSFNAGVDRLLHEADSLFFDGTFWSDDELSVLGRNVRRAADMAHWPLGGSNGSLSVLRKHPARRRILIHINNTNPILREDSCERQQVQAAGVEIAYDGMAVPV